MTGLPKKYAKMGFKKGWREYKKTSAYKSKYGKSSSKSKSKSKSTGGRKSMGKNGFNTQKIFKYVRLGALALPAAEIVMGPGNLATKIKHLKGAYFGIWGDGSFHWDSLAKGWLPFVIATIVTHGVPKLASIIRRF